MTSDPNPSAAPQAAEGSPERPVVQYINAEISLRFANWLLDGICLKLWLYPWVEVYPRLDGTRQEDSPGVQHPGLGLLVIGGGLFFYYVVLETLTGRTPGKFVTGTKAVSRDGSPLTWRQAFLRSICRLIPSNAISAFSGSPWHDTIPNTKVVRLWGKTAVIPRIPIVIGIAGRMPPAPRRPPSPLNRGSAPGAGGRADGHASPEDRPPDT